MMIKRWSLFLIITAMLIVTIMPAVSGATQEQINTAIDKGVTWLAAQQNTDGSFGVGDGVAMTGFAVLKLEDRAIEQGKSPFDSTYAYSDNVQKGLNYLFSHVQEDGGIVTNYQVYDTSIALMAICESGTPNRVVSGTGNPYADGKTYKEIAEAAVNRLVHSQTADGGWQYTTAEDDEAELGLGDQSNTGYATLGLVYAQKFGISIPAGTLGGINNWVNVIQGPEGYSMYMTDWAWPNVYKTGSLLYEFKMVGAGTEDARVQKAVGFIQNYWNYPGTSIYDLGWEGSYQACFGLMKGFEAQGISTITVDSNSVDWYDDMADWIVTTQNADGSWPADAWANYMGTPKVLTTCWALLTLEKTTEIPPAAFDVVKSASDTSIASGGSVTYTYLVVNTGLTPIADIVLTDDKLGTISGPASGDTNGNDKLDQLETWTYTKETTLSVSTTNTATASGNDPDAAPLSVTSNPVTVNVNGPVEPKMSITKSVSKSVICAGDSVIYTYEIMNTGSAPITNVVLTDNKLGVITGPASGDTNGNNQLDLSETWTYTKETTLSVSTTNTATASGNAPAGSPLSVTSDPVTVNVIDPEISITKSVSPSIGIIYAGDSVVYTYEVTNTGVGDLGNIVVTDDQNGVTPVYVSGDDGDKILETGEKWMYTAQVQLSDTVTNTGSVKGIDTLGNKVSAQSNTVTVIVLIPVKIDIKPGSCPNAFNRKDTGVLPVAIVGTPDLDVRSINTTKPITLNGVRAIKWEFKDAATPYSGTGICGCHAVSGDGRMDLIVYFPIKEIAKVLPGGMRINDVISLNLGGTLKNGKTIDGNDCIKIVK
jgi:hypothetical protein